MVDIQDGSVVDTLRVNLADHCFSDRMEYLSQSGCATLLCGAVSEDCLRVVTSKGVTVIPWLRGEVDHIINAFASDSLGEV